MKTSYTQSMASLTEIAYYSRKIIKNGLIALLVIILLKLLFDVGKTIYLKLYPPPAPAPTVKFGKLPKIIIEQTNQSFPTDYQLETPTGRLAEFPTQAKVYPFLELRPSLLAEENAKEEAAKLGYFSNPEIITNQIYRWSKYVPQKLTLEMDIFNNTYKITYDWQNDQDFFTNPNLSSSDQAIIEAKDFLKKKNSNSDLIEGRFETQFFKANNKKMISAVSLSEADFIKVDIYRQNLDDLPILTQRFQEGIVTIIFSGNQSTERRIVKADYNYFPLKSELFSTYPIKTSAQAWEELKNNQGYLINWNGSNKVVIRRIYLAYFDSMTYQKYLQPIFIFEGDDNFIAYVPAITGDWLE